MSPTDKMSTISLSRDDLERFARNDIGFYGLDISRISSIFIAQVLRLQTNGTINTHQMLDEVRYLEGLNKASSTKKEEPFKREPLKGLMKKHFTDARFIIKNLGAHFGYEHGGNRRLDVLVREAFSRNKSGHADDELIGFLAHNITIGALEERSRNKSISGEWIVYQVYNGRNYYLTLAAHDEGDDNIFKRVCDAYTFDFAFLRH